jgi:hypothetical protein
VAQQGIGGFLMITVIVRSQRHDRNHLVETAQEPADAVLQVAVADKHDRLIDVVKLDLLVSLFLEQVTVPYLAALTLDRARDLVIGNQVAHLALLVGNVAHKLE